TDESTIASPADVARAGLPPPINVELPASARPGGEAGSAPDAPPAAPTLDDALEREPDNVALLVERAARLGAAAHYSAAQLDYERALQVDPAHGEALTGLGVLLSRRGLWTEALPHLRRATEVDPGRTAAWYYLGEALNHVDDLAAAAAAGDGGRFRVHRSPATPEGAARRRGRGDGGWGRSPRGLRDPRRHPQRHRAGHPRRRRARVALHAAAGAGMGVRHGYGAPDRHRRGQPDRRRRRRDHGPDSEGPLGQRDVPRGRLR